MSRLPMVSIASRKAVRVRGERVLPVGPEFEVVDQDQQPLAARVLAHEGEGLAEVAGRRESPSGKIDLSVGP